MCILYNQLTWYLHYILLCSTKQVPTSLSQYLISFSCCCLTLWIWHQAFANLQITQPSNSQLYFENQWKHCQYLQVLLLILKDLHLFSPGFYSVLLWQCLFQVCLFVVSRLTTSGKVSKLSPIFFSGEQWESQTVFIGNIAAWINDSWNFLLWQQWWPAI